MKRNYGIDLLKMAAMTMVVAHHILQDGGIERKLAENAEGLYFEQLFHCFCYCAVDCFVLATGYIMCQMEFKCARIFRLWRQVVGYSLIIACVAWFSLPSGTLGWRDWLGAVMPISFNRYWFFTEYVALFLSMPLLNKMLRALTIQERGMMMVGGFVIFSVWPIVAGLDLFVTKWGYSYVWFLYLYLVGSCLSLDGCHKRIATWHLGVALVVGVLGSAGGAVLGPVLFAHWGGGARLGELAYSYASPTMFLEAVALLLLFSRLNVKSERLRKIIGFLAPSTFVVYIVHSNGLFLRLTEWKNCLLSLADVGECGAILGTAVLAVLIFTVIVIFDATRRVVVACCLSRGGRAS